MEQKNHPAPLTTLEVPTASPAAYTHYWDELRHDHPEALAGQRDIEKIGKLGKLIAKGSFGVVRDLDTTAAQALSQVRPEAGNSVSEAVQTWDRMLGTFNHMEEGEGDMLRAAGLVLSDNVVKNAKDEFIPASGEPGTVYDAFVSMFENNKMEDQKSTPALLTAGQLVHKAGWVEKDPYKQTHLFDIADKIYSRIYEDASLPWQDHKFLAGQLRADIRFHAIGRNFRSLAPGNVAARNDLAQRAVGLMREQIGNLMRMSQLMNKVKTPQEKSEWSGKMFEAFALIALRDALYISPDAPVVGYEVRRAFTSEDEPLNLHTGKRRDAFDLVIQKYDQSGKVIATNPVQLKLGKNSDEKGNYRPEITYVRVTNLSPQRMMQAADNLLVAYGEHDYHKGIGPLREVQATLQSTLAKL